MAHRIAILVNGRLEAVDTPQALKDLYGADFSIELKAVRGTIAQLVEAIQAPQALPQARILSVHGDTCSVAVSRESVHLSALFQFAERLKNEGKLEEYSISQSTLEQVFLRIAKKQVNSDV